MPLKSIKKLVVVIFFFCFFFFYPPRAAVSAAAHPRLLITQPRLKQINDKITVGKTKAAYEAILSETADSSNKALDKALMYYIKNNLGESGYGGLDEAKSFLLNYIRDPANAPAKLWEYPVKYRQGYDATPIALLYDWTFPALTSAEQEEVRAYLVKWVTIFNTYLKPESSLWLYNNQITSPAAALGVILMAIEGENGAPANAVSLIKTLSAAFQSQFFTSAINPRGNLGEGIWYQNLSLPVVTVFAACATQLGYLDLNATYAKNIFNWFLYAGISNKEFIQYGDAEPVLADLWPQYLFYADYFNQPRDWATWNYYQPVFPVATYWQGIGDNAFFLLFYKPQAPAFDLNTLPKSEFLYDRPENKTGGTVIMRNGFKADSTVVTLINRYTNHIHQHYDPNSISLSYKGKRFLIDHNGLMPYNDPNHGVDFEHNLVTVDDGGSPKNDQPWSDDVASYGEIPVFMQYQNNALAVGDARYPVMDLSKIWNAYQTVDENKLKDFTPAVKATRIVSYIGDFFATPLITVIDDYQVDNRSHLYSLLYHFERTAKYAGNGTAGSPFVIDQGGDKLAIFLGGGDRFEAPVKLHDGDAGAEQADQYHYVIKANKTGVAAQYLSFLLPASSVLPTVTSITTNGLAGYRINFAGSDADMYYYANPNYATVDINGIQTDGGHIFIGLKYGRVTFVGAVNYLKLLYQNAPLGQQSNGKRQSTQIVFTDRGYAGRLADNNLAGADIQGAVVRLPDSGGGGSDLASPAGMGLGVCHWPGTDGLSHSREVNWFYWGGGGEDWTNIEPAKGQYDFSKLDKQLDDHFKLYPDSFFWLDIMTAMPGSVPDWAKQDPQLGYLQISGTGSTFPVWNPNFQAAFTALLTKVSEHIYSSSFKYRDRIKAVIMMSGGAFGEMITWGNCPDGEVCKKYEAAGYSEKAYIEAMTNWLAPLYARLFPDYPLVLQLGGGLYNNNITETMIRSLYDKLGSRLALKWNGWNYQNSLPAKETNTDRFYQNLMAKYADRVSVGFEPGGAEAIPSDTTAQTDQTIYNSLVKTLTAVPVSYFCLQNKYYQILSGAQLQEIAGKMRSVGPAAQEAGDANQDGSVTLLDYYYFVLKQAGGTLPGGVDVDFNHDGKIDSQDRQVIVDALK